ncbi:M23 family metallopeptidase [Acidocella sp.]|uniref:M23 family metallopeptidase n=1 Tax=Acidocella sp. TaxID=50710 RepID=UPI002615D1BE|nr:M23 family metallopeptidase [Acidocella sp.]
MSVAKIASKFRALAHKWVPERQLLVRDHGAVRALHLKTSHQLAALAALGLLAGWGATSLVACFLLWHGQARAAHAVNHLRTELASTQADLGAASARDSVLSDASSAAQARVAALDAQTRAAIAQVQNIIAQSGLNMKRLPAHASAPIAPLLPPAKAKAEAAARPAHGPEAALSRDLGTLDNLNGLLRHIPLAAPVADMSMSSPYGMRPNPWNGTPEFHVGIDLTGAEGAAVYATAAGTVSFAGVQTGYGLIVEINHGYGLSTRYSHLAHILVRPGQHVAMHQEIGLLGDTGWSTGPHLLYETRLDGAPENPLDFLKVSARDVQAQD